MLYFNNLPPSVEVSLFDDTEWFPTVESPTVCVIENWNIGNWAQTWWLKFNAEKCSSECKQKTSFPRSWVLYCHLSVLMIGFWSLCLVRKILTHSWADHQDLLKHLAAKIHKHRRYLYLGRHVFDVWHMWRLATRESADFQKQLPDFQLTARLFTHSADNKPNTRLHVSWASAWGLIYSSLLLTSL